MNRAKRFAAVLAIGAALALGLSASASPEVEPGEPLITAVDPAYDYPADLRMVLPLQAAMWEPSQRTPPFRIFDNIHYVGTRLFAAYLVETSEGALLIDSGPGGPLQDALLAGIRELGFEPGDVKYVLVTHGHVDHVGGAAALQRYGARVVMSEPDWSLAEAQAEAPGFQFALPRRDRIARDGELLSMGDTTVRFRATPGHTLGAMSYELPARDGGLEYRAIVLGGLGTNYEGLAQARAHVQSMAELVAMARGAWSAGDPLSVYLGSHPQFGEIFERKTLLDTRPAGQLHPYVDPFGVIHRFEDVLADAKEKVVVEEAALAPPPTSAPDRVDGGD